MSWMVLLTNDLFRSLSLIYLKKVISKYTSMKSGILYTFSDMVILMIETNRKESIESTLCLLGSADLIVY